jgi:hypothetical protein
VSDCADPSPRHLSPVALFVRAYRKRKGRRREEGREREKSTMLYDFYAREQKQTSKRKCRPRIEDAQCIATPRTRVLTCPGHPSFLRQSVGIISAASQHCIPPSVNARDYADRNVIFLNLRLLRAPVSFRK